VDQPQPERHRSVIRQRDLHVGAETAGLDFAMARARLAHGMVEQAPPVFRRGGRRERGPGAGAGIGRQRELRHQQQAAFVSATLRFILPASSENTR
jgi:hypothetical protein